MTKIINVKQIIKCVRAQEKKQKNEIKNIRVSEQKN